jgi:transposase
VTVGIDLGDRFSTLCLLNEAGEVSEEGRISSTPEAFRRRFHGVQRYRIVLEAGTHSPWASRALAECGHEVIVANPRKLTFIFENDTKTDKTDPERLARVARTDPSLLAPLRHRGPKAQADIALIRARDAVVAARTRLINCVRGLVKSGGHRLTKCSTAAFHKKVVAQIPDELRPSIEPVLEAIESMTTQIRVLDSRVERAARADYPETCVLAQVPGVGPLTALAFVLTLEDPSRFRRRGAVASYLGLRPRLASSGASDPQLGITKAGNSHLRRLLVGSAHYILGPFGPDSDLRRWGLRLATRGGKNAKKRAVVALARKLSILLLKLWITGECYEPLLSETRRAPSEAATQTAVNQ